MQAHSHHSHQRQGSDNQSGRAFGLLVFHQSPPFRRETFRLFYTAIRVVARIGCVTQSKRVRLVGLEALGLGRDVSCV